jgi:uncharacterized protein (TIGR02678 family)
VVTDRTARLFRLPLAGTVHAPRRFRPPSRRVLVLALPAAAVAEDAEDVTTTQDLSDRVRVLTNREDLEVAIYDPDRFAERALFVTAVELLISLGGLRASGRGDEERREGWAHRRDAIGGAYEVQREPLLRLVEPAGLDAVLSGFSEARQPADFAARHGVTRRLLELPVCLYDDLSEAERSYLSSQRHRVLAWCVEMTGWTVEQRAEGMALIAADEADTDLPFPRLRAADFATVMLLDRCRRRCPRGAPESDDQGPGNRRRCRRHRAGVHVGAGLAPARCGWVAADPYGGAVPQSPGGGRESAVGFPGGGMTIETRTSLDAAAWLAAVVNSGLPEPGLQRWQPLRVGIVSMWEHDDVEFWFADGRMVLRGGNGAGKTKVLELTTLMLLRGDIQPSDLDPFGSQHRTMRFNLLPTGEGDDPREPVDSGLWYAWVEFGRVDEGGQPAYFTCGLGASARRGTWTTRPEVWHFHTSLRHGQDFSLTSGGHAVRAKELRAVDGIETPPNAKLYRAAVAGTLFGLDSEAYDRLTDLLKQLRRPKLGERLNPSSLAQTLREALPPVAGHETSHLAKGWKPRQRVSDRAGGVRSRGERRAGRAHET